jgi:hypothetical protein
MTDETNESTHKVPVPDSTKQAENSSPEHIAVAMVPQDATAAQDTMITIPEDQPGFFQGCPIRESTPVFPETELATHVASLLREYRDLNDEINDITTDALNQADELQKSTDKLNPRVAHMHSVLSQRGELHRRLKSNELPPEITEELLAQINALPGWSEWYEDYRVRVKSAASLRTV